MQRAAYNSDELNKLRDRFPVSIELDARDIREITWRRLLTKASDGETRLRALFGQHGQALLANTRLNGSALFKGDADETSFVKKGDKTPGVKRQWCGAVGKKENCMVTVHLGYARDASGRLDTSDEDCQLWGVGARMSEMAGALALAQLRKLPDIVAAMHGAKWRIRQALEDIRGLRFRIIPDPAGDTGMVLICILPNEAICHMTIVRTEPNAMNGVRAPGCALCHAARVKNRPKPSTHEPTTTNVRPM